MYDLFAYKYGCESIPFTNILASMMSPCYQEVNVEIDTDGSIYGFDALWGASLQEARERVESTQHRIGAMYEINGNVEYEDLDEGKPELDESDIVYLGNINDIPDGAWVIVGMSHFEREGLMGFGVEHYERVALLDSVTITVIPDDVNLESIMEMTSKPYRIDTNDDDFVFRVVPKPEYIPQLANKLEAGPQKDCELSGEDFCTVLSVWYSTRNDSERLPNWRTPEGLKLIIADLRHKEYWNKRIQDQWLTTNLF